MNNVINLKQDKKTKDSVEKTPKKRGPSSKEYTYVFYFEKDKYDDPKKDGALQLRMILNSLYEQEPGSIEQSGNYKKVISVSHKELIDFLNKLVKDKILITRQDPFRVFAYYQAELITKGTLKKHKEE